MPSRSIIASAVAVLLMPAAGVAAATSPVAAPDSIGIQLIGRPSSSPTDPRARSYIVERAAPGTRIRRRVEITNTTSSTAFVTVYPAAAVVRNGRLAFASARSGNELTGWTSVSRSTLPVPAGGSAFETVTIAIPAKASSKERYAVIWAQVSAPAPAGGGMTLVNRVGIRMYVTVGPGGTPAPNFVIGPLAGKRSTTGSLLVMATVHDIGRGTLGVHGSLMLTRGPGGVSAGPYPATMTRRLTADESAPVTVGLDGRLPRGPWHARLVLRSGAVQRTAVASITFPPNIAAEPAGTARPGLRSIVIAIVGLVLLVSAAVALWRIRRRAELKLR